MHYYPIRHCLVSLNEQHFPKFIEGWDSVAYGNSYQGDYFICIVVFKFIKFKINLNYYLFKIQANIDLIIWNYIGDYIHIFKSYL